MIRRLREYLSTSRAPSGYRPGATLQRLGQNLGQGRLRVIGPSHGVISDTQGNWRAEVRERVEAHLLMHVVCCEFELRVPARQGGALTLELRHCGAIRRTGLTCVYRNGDRARFAQVRDRILGDAPLVQALMPLDFTRLLVQVGEGDWTVTLEHMGGSEVVNRLPAFRRYLQISPEQRALLFSGLGLFGRALRER